MTERVVMTLDVSEDFLSNVLITAFDANYGGCWYWARPSEVAGDPWQINEGVWWCVYIEDREDDWEGTYLVNHPVIVTGIQNILDGRVQINDGLFRALLTGLREDDAGVVDADVADCIVQAGVFGEIVYG